MVLGRRGVYDMVGIPVGQVLVRHVSNLHLTIGRLMRDGDIHQRSQRLRRRAAPNLWIRRVLCGNIRHPESRVVWVRVRGRRWKQVWIKVLLRLYDGSGWGWDIECGDERVLIRGIIDRMYNGLSYNCIVSGRFKEASGWDLLI